MRVWPFLMPDLSSMCLVESQGPPSRGVPHPDASPSSLISRHAFPTRLSSLEIVKKIDCQENLLNNIK